MAFLLTVLAAPLLCGALLAGTATGATLTAQSRHAASSPWFQLKSADYQNTCIGEKNKTSAVAGVPCSSSHSDYWRWTPSGGLRNENSGKCLAVTGSQPGVYVNTCGTNHAQLWGNQTVDVFAGGKLYLYEEFTNVHTGESLGIVLGTSVVQESSGNILWVRG
jgi:hypothetical protein